MFRFCFCSSFCCSNPTCFHLWKSFSLVRYRRIPRIHMHSMRSTLYFELNKRFTSNLLVKTNGSGRKFDLVAQSINIISFQKLTSPYPVFWFFFFVSCQTLSNAMPFVYAVYWPNLSTLFCFDKFTHFLSKVISSKSINKLISIIILYKSVLMPW